MLAASTYNASDGTAYERFLGRWTRVLATQLLDFAEFPPDGPLLDVGTGTGSLAVAMAMRWPSRRRNRRCGTVYPTRAFTDHGTVAVLRDRRGRSPAFWLWRILRSSRATGSQLHTERGGSGEGDAARDPPGRKGCGRGLGLPRRSCLSAH